MIVNFTDDPTTALRAVLWATRGPWLTFREVEALKVGNVPTPLDGEVIVHRDRVAFLQVP